MQILDRSHIEPKTNTTNMQTVHIDHIVENVPDGKVDSSDPLGTVIEWRPCS